MQDMNLYLEWRDRHDPDPAKAIGEIRDWLLSGWLRICYPDSAFPELTQRRPFDPFGAYVHDEETILSLMVSLRDLSLLRSDADAILLRRAVSEAISSWDFRDESKIFAIRVSFRVGTIFGCIDVCDQLIGLAQSLVASQTSVITGLSDMALSLGANGKSLVEHLVAVSAAVKRVDCLPYLLNRLVEQTNHADAWKQRGMILDLVGKYGAVLQDCGTSIDALEALTDTLIDRLRLIEGVLPLDQLERLDRVAEYLDDEAISSIPQLRDVRIALIENAKAESSDFECCLLED